MRTPAQSAHMRPTWVLQSCVSPHPCGLFPRLRGAWFVDNRGVPGGRAIARHESRASSLEPYFWKTPNDNQKHSGYEREMGKWKKAAERIEVRNIEILKQENLVSVKFEMNLPTIGANYTLQYKLNGKGQLQTEVTYTPLSDTIPHFPKFGRRVRIPEREARRKDFKRREKGERCRLKGQSQRMVSGG
jgi:hypothetical protein